MRKFSNVSRCYYSPIRKKSSRIDWNKQMLYEKLYPGKIFYKEDHVFIRSSSGGTFQKANIRADKSASSEYSDR